MNKKGLTLIETLIYVAIISGILLTFSSFMFSISDSRNKTYVAQEVHANTRNAFDFITQKVQSAKSININDSVFDTDPCVLSLETQNPATNPTIISLDQDDGTLQITEGANLVQNVTSAEVGVTEFICKSISPNGKRENVQIEMTVAYNPTADDVIFNYSQSIRTAVSVRGK